MKNKWRFFGILIAIALILGFCVYQVSRTYLEKQIAENGPVPATVQTAD